jgi:uncharacterized protein (DUF58 family)
MGEGAILPGTQTGTERWGGTVRWWFAGVALLAASLVFHLGWLMYAMYVFLGVLLISHGWARRWTASMEVDRRCPVEKAEIGDKASVTVTLRYASRGRIPWLLVEEALPLDALRQIPPRLRVTGGRLAVLSLERGGVRVLEYEVEFRMRGYYQIGPLLLESGDLFGLHRRYRVATEPSFVLVRPRIVPLQGYDLASKRPVGEVRIQHRLFEDPTRIQGVRAYERGDPLNRIHWRATARTGSLQSKVHEPSTVAGATLLLDFHRESFTRARRPTLGSAPAFPAPSGAGYVPPFDGLDLRLAELVVTTAASLASAIAEIGQQVGLVTNGRDAADRIRTEGWRHEFRTRAMATASVSRQDPNERIEPIRIATHRAPNVLGEILDTLGRLELTDGFELTDLIHTSIGRLPRDATVAAILTHVTEESAIALGTLRRHGFVVVVILVTFDEVSHYDWASPPDWAARLMAEGIEFRRIEDEDGLAQLCAAQFVR